MDEGVSAMTELATSSATSSPGESAGYNTAETVTLSIVISVLSLLTLAGNVLVIVAFATDVKLRTFGNYFILNLSITDLLVGILIPIYAPYPLLGRWPLGRRACVAFNVVDYIVPLASSWNIAVISLDRYISVSRPVYYRVKQSTRWAILFMAIPWTVGFLVFAPAIIFWEHMTGRVSVPEGECWVEYYDHIPYLLFGSFMEFILPFITLSVANLLIYLNIRRRTRATSGGGDDVKRNLARDQKTARSLAILVGIYLVTWAPYEVCALMQPLCGCVPDKVFDVTFWWLWTNSTINPILYPFLQIKFRVAFRRILCGRERSTSTVHPIGGDIEHPTGAATVNHTGGDTVHPAS